MLKLLARIILKTEDEGGMTLEGFSGMRPSFNVHGELIASEIYALDDNKWLIRGVYHNVQIDLLYGEIYLDRISSGMKFKLQTGNRVIGEGEVIAVEN